MRGLDQASVMGMELIAAVLLWAGIGWLVDGWLGTPPWGLVIGAILGNAAGMYLIFLRANQLEGYRDLPKPVRVVTPATLSQATTERPLDGR